jgi:hypothetical protein
MAPSSLAIVVLVEALVDDVYFPGEHATSIPVDADVPPLTVLWASSKL